MGSLDIKSDQKVSDLELENTSNESDSTEYSPTTSDKNDLLELISDSSTSSGDFMLEDPFQDSENDHGENTYTGTDQTIESPPIQTMERPNPTTQKSRIPSSVFARKESINPGWGMPSNESLFSIHTGSLNFRNQDSLVWRSADLDRDFAPMEVGTIPELDEICTSSESDGSENFEIGNAGKAREFGEGRSHLLGEEDKIQSLSEINNNHGSIMNPNLQGDQEDQGSKSVVEERGSRFAAESSGSRSSFAFPILTADKDKGSSANLTSISENSEPQLETQPHSEPHSEPTQQSQPSEPKTDTPATTWTNCFGCCSFCC